MGSDKSKDDQIHSVVDAVHWAVQAKKPCTKLRIVLGHREDNSHMGEVLHAVALLIESLAIPINIQVEVDFKPRPVRAELFKFPENWLEFLAHRDEQQPPDLAIHLTDRVNDDSFRWYRNLSNKRWSGRVEGLQVCTISDNAKEGVINVGTDGKNGIGKAREVFLQINNNSINHFDSDNLEAAAALIKELAESRRNGDLRNYLREHLLESRVLRGAVDVQSEDGLLKTVFEQYPFQLPTLWAPQAKNPRYLDALMRLDRIPYAVELKEPNGSSPGQDYRHAITQVVLYREFIRRSPKLADWFEQKGLEAKLCKAVVAFPKIESQREKLLKQHKAVANAFDVEIVELALEGKVKKSRL
jgi:hypothetical protein